MKSKLLTLLTILFLSFPLFAQQNSNNWEKLDYLICNWKGEGNGKPGQGEGTFSFKLDLDKNILVRISHTEDPSPKEPNEGRGYVHNDLMIIYRDSTGTPNRAIYFDNENHVINYSISHLTQMGLKSQNRNERFSSTI